MSAVFSVFEDAADEFGFGGGEGAVRRGKPLLPSSKLNQPPPPKKKTENRPRCWQDHLEEILRQCGFVANMLDSCLRTHPTKRVSLVFHVDHLQSARTHTRTSAKSLPN